MRKSISESDARRWREAHDLCTALRGVNKFAQNGAPQSRRHTEQWQMLDDTIASASINEIRVLPQKHSPGVGGLSRAMVVVERQSRAQQACRIQQCDAVQPLQPGENCSGYFLRAIAMRKRRPSIRGRPLRLCCSLGLVLAANAPMQTRHGLLEPFIPLAHCLHT